MGIKPHTVVVPTAVAVGFAYAYDLAYQRINVDLAYQRINVDLAYQRSNQSDQHLLFHLLIFFDAQTVSRTNSGIPCFFRS